MLISSMTLQKLSTSTFEKYPILTAEEAELNQKIQIVDEPKEVIIRSTGKPKVLVNIKIVNTPKYSGEDSKERKITMQRTWFMNHQTSNFLIDLLGTEEKNWVGKEVEIEVITQVISGKKHKVIYAKGAIV